MGNKGKKPWKLFGSLSYGGNILPASATSEARRAPQSAPAIQQKPIEFVCPISGELMADPVILPNGQSYERSCILACIDLRLDNATLSANHLPIVSPTTQLIPNLGLRSAIIKWCESNGIQYPDPISAGVARLLVRNLISSQFHPSPRVHPHFSAYVPEVSTPFRSPHHQMPPEFTPMTPLTGDDHVSSADYGNMSSQSIEEEKEDRSVPQGIPMELGSAVLEEQIVTKLGSTNIAEQEVALLLLRHVTREHPEQRTDLCSRRLLSSLCPYLLSPNQSLQSNALAALVNLSIHQSNKIPIVRSRAVPSLITALDSGHAETRSDTVAAIFSLSVVAENKTVIGELGAIPPLLHLLSQSDEILDTRRQAALALHHLISACPTNLSRLVNTPGSAKALLNVVLMESTLLSFWKKSNDHGPTTPTSMLFKKDLKETLCGYVMMAIGTMAGTSEGSTALTDARAVETMVDMMKTLQNANNHEMTIKDPTLTNRRNQCVGVLSRLSRGSLKFRLLATEAGAEQVLAQFCAKDDDADEGDNGTDGKHESRNFKEKARKMLSDLRRDGSNIALPNRRVWSGG